MRHKTQGEINDEINHYMRLKQNFVYGFRNDNRGLRDSVANELQNALEYGDIYPQIVKHMRIVKMHVNRENEAYKKGNVVLRIADGNIKVNNGIGDKTNQTITKVAHAEYDRKYSYISENFPFDHLTEAKSLSVELYNKDGQYEKLNLPDFITQNLLDYLKGGQRYGKQFTCTAFAQYLYGKVAEANDFSFSDWKINNHKHTQEDFVPGDILSLGESELDISNPRISHFAIYLGKGLYISKFGTAGLFVTDLEHLIAAYSGNNCITVFDPLFIPQKI